MSSYSELIKNFEKIRSYMREFYVYGFKSREEYKEKSARSYDDERRRMESWLGDYMGFTRTSEGKNVFISIDSRVSRTNPLYKALKSKSFTDGDITLHFILLDILHSAEQAMALPDILREMEGYLSAFQNPMFFDESTIRKKLKEYVRLGLVVEEKLGRKMLYRRAEDELQDELEDVLHYFSEIAPCGVIGSFLLDKAEYEKKNFAFKHHYITSAIDSNVTAMLFTAMQKKCFVTVTNFSRHSGEPQQIRIIPLRIFISVQNGRQHLLAYQASFGGMTTLRVDYLSNVVIEEPAPRFDELRAELDDMQTKMWGVTTSRNRHKKEALEHVEFTLKINDGEEHIIRRLEREKRTGQVEKIDDHTYRFKADVYDSNEVVPWIRTFICRIVRLDFSNRTLENLFKEDIAEMYRMYGIEEAEQ